MLTAAIIHLQEAYFELCNYYS